MYMSRKESRDHDRRRRKRRLKRLMVINALLAALIVIFAGLIYASNNWPLGGGGEIAAPPGSGTNADANAGMNDGAANMEDSDSADEVESGGSAGVDQGLEPGSEAEPGTDGSDLPMDQPEVVRLGFVGDILLASSVENLMRRNGFDYPYAKALPYLQAPDLLVGNLENPITTGGVPAEDKKYVFKGHPDLVPSLKEAGFDVVSLANNHTLDQGVEGLLDTIRHLDEAGIPNMGAGNNDTEAFAPVVLEANGFKVAYFGLSRVVPWVSWKADKNVAGVAETYDSRRAVAAIQQARVENDLIVVYAHWGEELSEVPRSIETTLAREYIDAGADLVVGAHPHVLQGIELYKGKWIAYSLGNFIFNMTKTEESRDTGVLEAVCTKDGSCELQFHPMWVDAPSQPAPLEGEAKLALLDRLEQLSFGVVIDDEGRVTAAP